MPGVCGGDGVRVESVGVGGEEVGSGLKAEKFPQKNNCDTEKDVKYNTAVNGKKRTESRKERA
jgi:hypothetical protein